MVTHRCAFERELDMLPVLAVNGTQLAAPRFRAVNPTSVCELPMGLGIPDLVVGFLDEEALAARQELGVGPLQERMDVAVLACIGSNGMEIGDLAMRTGVSPRQLRHTSLARLTQRGIVEQIDRRRWRATFQYRPLPVHIVAVEAKLRDWRRGVGQARRYLRFANRVYLALDAHKAAPAIPHRRQLRELGVGLVTVAACDSAIEVVGRPVERGALSRFEFSYAGELLWSLSIQGLNWGSQFPVFGRELTAQAVAPTS